MDEQKIEYSESYKISLGSLEAGGLIIGVGLVQEPTYWTGSYITKKENPLISRLKEILRCENYVFEKTEHKSAIYVLEKDNVLSLGEKHREIELLVEYEKRKAKVKMLKELISHFENVERRERDEKS